MYSFCWSRLCPVDLLMNWFSIASPALAQAVSAAKAEETLQQEAANPIGNLTSIPFQENVNFGVGQFGHIQNLLAIQPVIPLPTANGGSLVWRTIFPSSVSRNLRRERAASPGSAPSIRSFTTYRTPGRSCSTYGPTFLLPTASDPSLGQGQFGIGPNLALVVTNKDVVYGAIANNIWSLSAASRSEVNQFFVQPFLSLTLPRGVTLETTSAITANWEALPGRRWTVPIGRSYTKLLTLGNQLIQISGGVFDNIVRPVGGAQWTARLETTLLLPRK
jgi:hypothetical protein